MGNEDVLAAWLAAHHGVVTRQWLREHLFTDGHVRGLRESGRLVEVHRGVYVATSARRTQLQRMVALVTCSDGAISHASAGRLWGFRKLSRHHDIHVSVIKGARRRTEGSGLNHVVLHSTSELPAADVVRRSDGIVYTSAARTVFDLSVDSRRFSARCRWNWPAVTSCIRIWPSRAVSSSSKSITRPGTAATSKAATTDGAIASTVYSAGTRSG